MKAQLSFDLELQEDRTNYRIHNQATDMYFMLIELFNLLRKWDKHKDRETISIEELRTELRRLLEGRDIKLDL